MFRITNLVIIVEGQRRHDGKDGEHDRDKDGKCIV